MCIYYYILLLHVYGYFIYIFFFLYYAQHLQFYVLKLPRNAIKTRDLSSIDILEETIHPRDSCKHESNMICLISCRFWSLYTILRRIRTASCSFARFSAESRGFIEFYTDMLKFPICTISRGVSYSLRDRVRFRAIFPRFSCKFALYRTVLHGNSIETRAILR